MSRGGGSRRDGPVAQSDRVRLLAVMIAYRPAHGPRTSRGDGVSRGSNAMRDVNAKLDWASEKHDEMLSTFEAWLKPGGGDDRPCGIRWHAASRPSGLLVAFFSVDHPMPAKMTMLAADLVHNTRSALDHVLARLKEHLGGDPGQGHFPTRQRAELWQQHIIKAKKSPLDGLPADAVELIYREQPLHRAVPAEDPLVILNRLDNTDKHEMLNPAFAYPDVTRGLDLIEVLNPGRVKLAASLWRTGEELKDGTAVARFMVSGNPQRIVRARDEARLGFATGLLDGERTSYTAMIDRVRDIAGKAAALIDAQP
jgi:hypothetical protein